MAQRIDKLYRLVTIPAIYKSIQSTLGADRARRRYVAEVLRPRTGARFLDVGCGPATILPYLPEVDYTGLDLNRRHIDFAQRAYAGRGTFVAASTSEIRSKNLGRFELVSIVGLIHHLNDDIARELLSDCCDLTVRGGRIVTIDPVWLPRQRIIARGLKKLDSGLSIRTPASYQALTDGLPVTLSTLQFDNLLRFPYDHFCMSLRRQ